MVDDSILQGDCLEVLRTQPDDFVDCCVTSPPYYGLRSYLPEDHPDKEYEVGLEQTPEEYVSKLVEIFREVRRVLKPKGTLWLNLGDSYAANGGARSYGSSDGTVGRGYAPGKNNKAPRGLKPKDMIGIPWMVAFALRVDGWYLRSDIIWHKPNCMPESVTDRPTKSHEYLFLLSKSKKYYYDAEAVKEPNISNAPRTTKNGEGNGELGHGHFGQSENGRNKRTVWTINTKPYKGAHFATFPEKLIEPCILAGCPGGGIVLDPFFGAGTTGVVAKKLSRSFIGIELKPEYVDLARKRIASAQPPLSRFVAEAKND